MVRSANELRAAASETGWFNGPIHHYQGDGYSVPWQCGFRAVPGLGGTMWIYKAYLDRICPKGAHLHDWLYTPYGAMIGATRDEADRAIREDLAEVSPVDAEVVYLACSLGGGPYFGISPVGYVAPPLPPAANGSNMELAPAEGSGHVADYKVVMIFQQTSSGDTQAPELGYGTVPRTGGWSESYWDANATLADVLRRLFGPRNSGRLAIAPARAAVLNSSARILGARIYEAGGGRGQFYPRTFQGSYLTADQPNTALLCATTSTGTVTVRRFTMRGISDEAVVNGEFAPQPQLRSAVRNYFDSLVETSIRGRVANPKQSVFNIAANGLVTGRVALPYAVGQIVTINQSTNATGDRKGGEYAVGALGPLANQLTLTAWEHGATTGGTISVPAVGWFTVGTGATTAVRITTRKIGRPFNAYRGRNKRAKSRT